MCRTSHREDALVQEAEGRSKAWYHGVWIVVSLEGAGGDASTGWVGQVWSMQAECSGGGGWRRGARGAAEPLYLLSPAPSTLFTSGSGVPAEPHSCSTLFTHGRLGLAFCTTEIWQVCES